MTACCPHCGRPLVEPSDDVLAVGDTLALSKHQRRIFNRLATSVGKWVDPIALVEAYYNDDPDGGADWARWSLSNSVRKLNRKLAGTGLSIETNMGRGHGARRLYWAKREAA